MTEEFETKLHAEIDENKSKMMIFGLTLNDGLISLTLDNGRFNSFDAFLCQWPANAGIAY